MAGRKSDFTLPTLDDLFSTQELRDDAKLTKLRDIPLELIDDFPDHPFKVRDDEDMMQLVESVKERGVITPATVRQKEDGTNDKGEIVIEGLRIGDYTVSEVSNSASSMYDRPADKKATVKTGSTTIVEMHNVLRDTPKTGDTTNLPLLYSLAGLSAAGIAVFGIISFKKKKKEDRS